MPTDAGSDDFGTAISYEEDPYAEIIQAMQPGLLITVNSSGGSNAVGSSELRVERQATEGEILLSGHNDSKYLLYPKTEEGPRLEKVSGSLVGHDVRPVETIEVIGIDDR